jgi:hypothetical protein
MLQMNEISERAKKLQKKVKLLNVACKKFNGVDVEVPDEYPCSKFKGRIGQLYCVTIIEGVVHGIINLYHLKDKTKFCSYPEMRFYIPITQDMLIPKQTKDKS